MKNQIRALIRRFGDDVTVVKTNGSTVVRAFLQPIMSRSWQNMQRLIPAGGQVPVGQFLYIGTPETTVDDAVELRANGRAYYVRRVDTVTFQNEVLFYWALLVEGGRDDPWTSLSTV